MDFLNINFFALHAQEKQNIIYKIEEILDTATEDYTFEQKILAQALFMERYYLFIQRILNALSVPVPVLLRDIRDYLWHYLKKECSVQELEKFHHASASVLSYILVDDDDNLDKTAWEKYKEDWDNSLYFNLCLEEAASEWSYILEQIVTKKANWYELTDGEFMAIAGYYIDTFDLEPIYKKEDGFYRAAENDRYWLEIYDSQTFGRAVSMLLDDLRIVKDIGEVSEEEIQRLYVQQQNKIIFDEQQIEKIIQKLK
ncbi:MAG: hypothetical protein K1W19_16995 [Lachnospiraceae bacterium]